MSVPGRVRYASVAVNGRQAAVAFVRGDGERLTVLVDKDGNGQLGESGEVFAAPVAGRDPGAVYWQVDSLPLAGVQASLALQEMPGDASASISAAGARRGTTTVGGRALHLHLLDADLDGSYDSAGDLWWFGPVDHLRQVRKLTPDAMVEANEPAFLDGRAWRLISVDDEGNAVVMQDAKAGTVAQYFLRRAERVNRTRWWPVFAAEEGQFRIEQHLDARRPRAAHAPHWMHDVDLRAALARAQQENKPVLVDFEADWCSWCKRFDYYVYVDAEVAELLSRFVLLKINKEFHFSGDFDRLGGTRLPYLVFVDPQGRPLTFTLPDERGQPQTCSGPPGFQGPCEFASTLRAALQAFSAR